MPKLKKLYLDSFRFIADSKKFIYFAILVMVIFVILGLLIPPTGTLKLDILSHIEQLLGQIETMGHLELISFIFLNNLKSSFLSCFLGVVLGIFTLFSTIANGYLIGFVSSLSVQEAGFLVLWKLVPHGIFELPAIFISLGLGFRLGFFIFTEKKKKYFVDSFIGALKVFVSVVIPLLIIAAIIEGSLIFFFR